LTDVADPPPEFSPHTSDPWPAKAPHTTATNKTLCPTAEISRGLRSGSASFPFPEFLDRIFSANWAILPALFFFLQRLRHHADLFNPGLSHLIHYHGYGPERNALVSSQKDGSLLPRTQFFPQQRTQHV